MLPNFGLCVFGASSFENLWPRGARADRNGRGHELYSVEWQAVMIDNVCAMCFMGRYLFETTAVCALNVTRSCCVRAMFLLGRLFFAPKAMCDLSIKRFDCILFCLPHTFTVCLCGSCCHMVQSIVITLKKCLSHGRKEFDHVKEASVAWSE